MKVSVIIPTCNRASYLKDALNSLTRQNFSPTEYEIVVVDNKSTDENGNLIWPNGLEPEGNGQRKYIRRGIKTIEEARQICKEYNDTHPPGRYSRKAEFEQG